MVIEIETEIEREREVGAGVKEVISSKRRNRFVSRCARGRIWVGGEAADAQTEHLQVGTREKQVPTGCNLVSLEVIIVNLNLIHQAI